MSERADTLAAIGDSRSWFETSASRNAHQTLEQASLVAGTAAKFDALLNSVEGNKTPTSIELQRYIDRGKELARIRAYVIPTAELATEAHEAVADMHNWSVPATVVEDLVRNVVPLVEGDEPHARAALRSLFETYDYWDTYVEIHARTMRWYAIVMLFFMMVTLAGGVILLYGTHVYSGVFCAGVAGALLSIIAKMPPLMGVGETNSYQLRIFSRLGIGVAASLIGMGLLCADVITIKLPAGSVAQLLNVDETAPASSSPARNGGSGSSDAEPASVEPRDGGVAALGDAATPVDGRVAGSGSPQTLTNVSSMQCVAGTACTDRQRKKHLPQSTVLILMALAMLFAFSERALASFEDAVFPRVAVPKVSKVPAPKDPGSGSAAQASTLPPADVARDGGSSPGGGTTVTGGASVTDIPPTA